MITSLILASAMAIPPAEAFMNTLDSANAANVERVSVCVQPPAELYSNAAEADDFETPIGKVDAISKDIAIIKNAIETGQTIKDATVDVAATAAPAGWKQWVYLACGALLAWLIKIGWNICGRFKAVCVNVNRILKQAEEASKTE